MPNLGPALNWTDDRLSELSAVTAEDMEAAWLAWQAASPALYDSLPLAPAEEDDDAIEELTIGGLLLAASELFVWDPVRGVYVIVFSQEVITFQVVREITERVAQTQLRDMESLSRQLKAGEISLADWQIGMARNIKILHVNAAVLARGGWAQMSQADWGAVGARVRTQYNYLRNFARQIADGTQALDGRLLVRSGMYEDAARGTYEDMRRRVEELYNGMEEEMRVLGAADHCDDCLNYAALRWQPIGSLPRIGDSQCRVNCHCRFTFRKRSENGWILSGV